MTLNKFTAGESRERTTLKEVVGWGGEKKIALKRDVGRRVIPRFSEGVDSLLTKSGQGAKMLQQDPSCSSQESSRCPDFRIPGPTCLICVYLTWRIRVQSVHLSPPTLPTTALRVIKPPDRAVHGERRTMSVLMRRVLATTSIPARQITVMNPHYDTQSKDAENPSDSRAGL